MFLPAADFDCAYTTDYLVDDLNAFVRQYHGPLSQLRSKSGTEALIDEDDQEIGSTEEGWPSNEVIENGITNQKPKGR